MKNTPFKDLINETMIKGEFSSTQQHVVIAECPQEKVGEYQVYVALYPNGAKVKFIKHEDIKEEHKKYLDHVTCIEYGIYPRDVERAINHLYTDD